MPGPAGGSTRSPPGAAKRDRLFLASAFQKLLINFTWWVNRKDLHGRHVFAGGFLGLDNIGLFDRSAPLPAGAHLDQADGTAWMAFYCSTMLHIALELASEDPVFEDLASKFFEHFVAIADALNSLGGTGLWHEEDGFYYDQLSLDGQSIPLRVRSLVGLIPLLAWRRCTATRSRSFRGSTSACVGSWRTPRPGPADRLHARSRGGRHLGGAPAARHSVPDRLTRVLRVLLDEEEFLSPFGIRSLSRLHQARPFRFSLGDREYRIQYEPGESRTGMFGGNSNWRGPVWFPMNYLLIEALERYHHFYGDGFKVECPARSGQWVDLRQASAEIARRLAALFDTDAGGGCPSVGGRSARWSEVPEFFEYFDGDTGRGLGARHQTGWTALAARFIEKAAGK